MNVKSVNFVGSLYIGISQCTVKKIFKKINHKVSGCWERIQFWNLFIAVTSKQHTVVTIQDVGMVCQFLGRHATQLHLM